MNRIKTILNQKGLKQTWLSEKLGKSYVVVNAYVQNRKQPSLPTLFQIANILEIDVRELLNPSKQKKYEKKTY